MKKLILPTIALSAVFIILSTTNLSAEGKHKDGHGHGHDSGHGEAHWASPKDAAARVNPIKSDQVSLDRGEKVFMKSCVSCHGKTAKGDGPVGLLLDPKPTDLTIMAGNHSDGDFEWKIANGRGSMPAWKKFLDEEQRWDVVNYIQALENPNGKDKMAGMDHSKMDHSKMSKEEMLKMDHSNMTKEEMSKMDHSNMTEAEMKKMMGTSHSDKDDHHKADKAHSKKKHTH